MTVALAGCVQLPGTPVPGAEGAVPDHRHLPFGLSGCDVVISFVAVDAEKLAPYMPEGFVPLTPEQAGLPADPRGLDATLSFESFRCESVVGLEKNVTDGAYGSIFTSIQKPEGAPEAGLYFVKWDVLVADKLLREALVAEGVPAVDGDAMPITNVPPAGGRGPIQGSLTLGEAVHGFNGAALQVLDPGSGGSFVEYTPTEHGLVRWFANFTWESISFGTGYMRVPAEGMGFEVIGAERAPAYFLYGRVTEFSNGDIRVPGGQAPQH